MDIKTLVKLTSRAWSLHILASLGRGVPGRQAPLLAASGASRTAFAQSLAHLVELGFLERNAGHGHPLRPEYRLTESGHGASRVADKIAGRISDPDDFALLRRSWTLPVLAVSKSPRTFTHIKTDLGPITDRALSHSLKRLEAQRWLHRQIDTSHRPPRPLYQVANAGAQISAAIALAP